MRILFRREYGLSGTKPVINKECMLVHERGQETVKVEWYRVDDLLIITASIRIGLGRFFDCQKCMETRCSFYTNKIKQEEKENKKMKKRTAAAVLSVVMAMAVMTGCGKEASTAKNGYRIGISQFAEHGSLDNCRKGFLEGLKEEGIEEGKNLTIDYKNAAADMGTASQIAGSFVSDKADMICGIATPSAQSAYNAAMDTGIPVIFTAVTDPKAAELSDKEGNPVGEVTGTSDKLPIEEQLAMIRRVLPDAKKIGIIYTTSEANSVSAIKEYKEKAGNYGFEIVEKGITNTSEVALAAEDILTRVDCLTNLTDNTVVNSLPAILDKANAAKIPVFGSEIEQVKKGCLAAEGLDYIALGKETGKMAAQILKGEKKASEMHFETITEASLYLNKKVAENLGITLEKALIAEAAESYDCIS